MASQKQKKKNQLPLICGTAVVIVAAVGVLVWKNGSSSQTAAEDTSVVQTEGNLIIPTETVTQTASFYPVEVDGTTMEVLAVRDSNGEIRTAFNTCQSCYTSGNGRYEAEDSELICQNCGFHFSADQVGIETGGGCNPWPITDENRTVTEDTIEISYDFLRESKGIFANWNSGR